MSTDRKIKGHAGSYGVAKYGLLVFRIPGAAGDPANWFEWLGVPCHRAGCRPAKRAAIRLSSHWLQNAKAFYGFLVRWKGFLRLRSRYETVPRTVFPKFVARGARQIWSLLSGVRIHCARHKNNRQISKDIYLLLVRWKGSSLSIERSTGPFSQIFSLRSKFGHSCSNPYNPKHNKKP